MQGGGVELAIAPGISVIHGLVADAVVVEERQQLQLDAIEEVALVGQVVAQAEHVGIGRCAAAWRSGQHEAGLKWGPSTRQVAAAAWWNSSTTM